MIFCYDTETTGLVDNRWPAEHNNQPHLVQLGCLLLADNGNEISCADLIIKPEGFEIPEEAARAHGITTAIALECGVPLATALSVFANLRKCANEVIAFNEAFDAAIMRTAFWRYGKQPSHPGPEKVTCVKELTTNLVNLPPTDRMKRAGFHKPKPPTLMEAYEFFFNARFTKAHSAVHDCRATAEVFFEFKRREACTTGA